MPTLSTRCHGVLLRVSILFAGVGLAGVLPAVPASAQPGVDVQQFHPMPDQKQNFFATSSGEVVPHLEAAGFVIINYAHGPVSVPDSLVISSMSTVNVLGSVGFFGRVEFGVDVPIVTSQSSPDLPRNEALSGLGDVRLVPKLGLYSTREEPGGPGHAVALVGSVFLPVGDPEVFHGRDPRGELRLALDATVLTDARVAVNAGFLMRRHDQVNEVAVTNAVTWAVAGELPLIPEISFTAEIFGRVGVGGRGPGSDNPTEILIGGKYHLEYFFMQAGGGAGLSQAAGTPNLRVFMGLGVLTSHSPVPDDVLGSTPEPVSADESDESDSEPEYFPPFDRGPRPSWVVQREAAQIDMEKKQIVINKTVHFETGSDVLDPRSYAILDAVAQIIAETPELRVRIEGHTDRRGDPELNMELSRRRAASVLEYIVERGVDRDRLSSQGLGQEQPIADNDTAEGRAKNRRVEFHVIEE